MTFQVGKSGNPNGRPKGALNKRTGLIKLLEPYADALISKMITLGLDGDTVALRLCVERLLPKARYESAGIELPEKIKAETIDEIRIKVVQAILDGKIRAGDAEIALRILTNNPDAQEPKEIDTSMITDEEAENMYKAVMSGRV